MKTRTFEELQKDLSLDDLKVQWMGANVRLYIIETNGKQKEISCWDATRFTVDKLKTYCIKNVYRCSQIQNGKVML